MKINKLLHLFSFLAYPLLGWSTYLTFLLFNTSTKALRTEYLNIILILVGFIIGLIGLNSSQPKPSKKPQLIVANLVIVVSLSVILVMVLLKDRFNLGQSIATGLLSIIVAVLGQLKSIAQVPGNQ